MTTQAPDAPRLVPVEPTEAMLKAMDTNNAGYRMGLGLGFMRDVWTNALAALPAVQPLSCFECHSDLYGPVCLNCNPHIKAAVQPAAGREEIVSWLTAEAEKLEASAAKTYAGKGVDAALANARSRHDGGVAAKYRAILAAISTPAQASAEPVAWPETLDWSMVDCGALCHWRSSFGDYVLAVVQGHNLTWSYRVNHTGQMNFDGLESATAAAMEDLRGRLKRRWSEAKETMRLYAHPPAQGWETGGVIMPFDATEDALDAIVKGTPFGLSYEEARYIYEVVRAALSAPQAAPGEGEQS